jgi:glutathionyl-hydroquinone reductase
VNKFSWVNMNIVKVVGFLIVVAGALFVCLYGMNFNAKEEEQRKIEYAEATLKSETAKIQQLNVQVSGFYKDETEEFLISQIEEDQIKQLESKINQLKIEASDFGLEAAQFSVDISEVSKEKEELVFKITDIKEKYMIQNQLTKMLLQAPQTWEVSSETAVINKEASADKLLKIQNDVLKKGGSWGTAMAAYITEMDAQVKLYTEIKQGINKMLAGDSLTSEATVENLIYRVEQLPQVKNEQLRKELSDQLDVIEELLNAQALGEEAPAEEPT